MHNAVMCTLSLYDVIRITRHLHIKFKSFYNIAQPLHKEAVRGCSFLYIVAKKPVIMSETVLVDVSILWWISSLCIIIFLHPARVYHTARLGQVYVTLCPNFIARISAIKFERVFGTTYAYSNNFCHFYS